MDDIEIWKPIKDFTDYQISSHGRVKSFKQDKINGKILSFGSSTKYYTIVLRRDNQPYNKYVHRLVAEAFIENDNPSIKNQVNHKDENTHNNNVNNLEWMSCRENILYGTHSERSLANRPKNIPHKRPVRCIETQQVFESLSEAARFLKVHNTSIKRACDGVYHVCKNYHWEYV